MNALARFTHTPHGWRIGWFIELTKVPEASVLRSGHKLYVQGRFNQPLRRGQFCKRPHRLLVM